MNREIKFRAWNIKNKFMEYIDDLYWFEENMIHNISDLKSQNYEFMQYTGLKDKNGIEIYEGDILKYNYHVMKNDANFYGQVIYDTRMFDKGDTYFRNIGFILKCKNIPLDEYYYCDIPDLKDIEVIGNIYENPELLN